MLVLSRKAEETIRIGDQIELRVVEIRGNVVRLGISAPRDIEILRGELDGERTDDGVSGLDGAEGLARKAV